MLKKALHPCRQGRQNLRVVDGRFQTTECRATMCGRMSLLRKALRTRGSGCTLLLLFLYLRAVKVPFFVTDGRDPPRRPGINRGNSLPAPPSLCCSAFPALVLCKYLHRF